VAPPLTIALPATSANLGPAFDAAGLAMGFALKVRARRSEAFSVRASGRDAGICARVEDHLILNVYRQTLAAEGREAPPLAIELHNEIPIGKGCGSSAAARLAGVALAAHFGELGWSAERVFEAAAALEGHPDNVAACWWGGLVISRGAPPAWLKIQLRQPWRLLVAVPEAALATEKARAVLPASYSRPDAVANLQNALLLIEALHQGRGELLQSALADRWHQPYRAALCPLLPALQPLAGKHGILGVALSGAGPSVLLFLAPDVDAAAASSAVGAVLDGAGLPAEILETQVQTRGPGANWRA
jgi:homoserine kinase